jgi:hypothetical protein
MQGRAGQVVIGILVGKVLGLEKQTPRYQFPQVNTGRDIGMGRVKLLLEELRGNKLVGLDIGQDDNVTGVYC